MYEDRKNAVVTGAARGIGKAIARNLAENGINVVISDVLVEEAEKTAIELAKLGVKAIAIKIADQKPSFRDKRDIFIPLIIH